LVEFVWIGLDVSSKTYNHGDPLHKQGNRIIMHSMCYSNQD